MNVEELKKSVSLDGKVAIVTGASRPNGQGFAATRALAVRSAKVVVTDISEAVSEMELKLGHGIRKDAGGCGSGAESIWR